jgi:NMD protein affecting ribosome stability and mRNA decay
MRLADSRAMGTPKRSTNMRGRLHRQRFGNPRLTEEVHDPYRSASKTGPQRCSKCGAIYLRGRWRWQGLTPPPPATIVCPACRRSADRYPAGQVIVSGSFAAAHGAEILRLVRNVEAAETREHPLHRIMAVKHRGGAIEVTTTDVHLPRRLGHALEDAWGGTLKTHYDEQGYFARVTWERND